MCLWVRHQAAWFDSSSTDVELQQIACEAAAPLSLVFPPPPSRICLSTVSCPLEGGRPGRCEQPAAGIPSGGHNRLPGGACQTRQSAQAGVLRPPSLHGLLNCWTATATPPAPSATCGIPKGVRCAPWCCAWHNCDRHHAIELCMHIISPSTHAGGDSGEHSGTAAQRALHRGRWPQGPHAAAAARASLHSGGELATAPCMYCWEATLE